jgi:hypothetical protein
VELIINPERRISLITGDIASACDSQPDPGKHMRSLAWVSWGSGRKRPAIELDQEMKREEAGGNGWLRDSSLSLSFCLARCFSLLMESRRKKRGRRRRGCWGRERSVIYSAGRSREREWRMGFRVEREWDSVWCVEVGRAEEVGMAMEASGVRTACRLLARAAGRSSVGSDPSPRRSSWK